MEEQGDLRRGEDGAEGSAGFPQLRPVSRNPAPGAKPQGGGGPLMVGCRCPAGVKGPRGHSPGKRGSLGPETPLGKPEAWPQGLLLPQRALAMEPGPARPGPGSPEVNGFCGHQGQGAADSFMEKGARALGD